MKNINIILEENGMNNSARAVKGDTISISKLLEMRHVNMEDIIYDVKFAAEHIDETENIINSLSQKLYDVICVAHGWNKTIVK